MGRTDTNNAQTLVYENWERKRSAHDIQSIDSQIYLTSLLLNHASTCESKIVRSAQSMAPHSLLHDMVTHSNLVHGGAG